MSGSPPSNIRPLVTSAVLIETSLGKLVVDLYGADCPVATAELINLCRCKYFNGFIASEVVPDNVVIFSHPLGELQQHCFASLLAVSGHHRPLGGSSASEAKAVRQSMREEWRRMRRQTAQLQRGNSRNRELEAAHLDFLPQAPLEAAGAICRSGLLLLEVPQVGGEEAAGESWRKMRLVLTVSNRHQDYFEDNFMVVGEVREGSDVVNKMRVAPHTRLTSASGITARPSRLIRIRHMTVLPTAGTEAFDDVFHRNREGKVEESDISSCLTMIGCFRYWATVEMVHAANKSIVHILRRAAGESTASGDGTHQNVTEPPSDGWKFFVVPKECAVRATPLVRSTGQLEGPAKDEVRDESDFDIVSVEYNPHFHGNYLSSDEDADDDGGVEVRKEREQRRDAIRRFHQDKLNETRSLTLNLLDGIGDASGELKPEGNVLFVCRLNPLTTSEGLEMCFSQFGQVKSTQVIRDAKSGDSLCYGFVEFADEEMCYRAYQKMDNALVDDRRIHVDFSQSVSKIWMERQREMRKRSRQGT